MTKDEYNDVLFARNNISFLIKDMKSTYMSGRKSEEYAFNLRETKRVLDKMLLDYQHGKTIE